MAHAPYFELIARGLDEDQIQSDWTARGVESQKRDSARVIAKSKGVWAASSLLAGLREWISIQKSQIQIIEKISDGAVFEIKTTVIEFEGNARLLLGLERTLLNLISYSCGIATATRELVDQIKKEAQIKGIPAPRLCHTRKILPAYRDLAIEAVLLGGGHPHRRDLASGVLIKENHIAAMGGIAQAIRQVLQHAPHGLKVEIEVRNLDELVQALEAGAHAVMLDNFSPQSIPAAVRIIKEAGRAIPVEVSGGINTQTIGNYVQPGVDVISVGALTHSVRAVDFSLLMNGVSE